MSSRQEKAYQAAIDVLKVEELDSNLLIVWKTEGFPHLEDILM